MARQSVGDGLLPRDLKLREVAERRLERLREREGKLRRHLESERGQRDHQALRFLLHQVEVERNDLFQNLKDPSYVPRPGRAKRGTRERVLTEPPTPRKLGGGPSPTPTKHAIPAPIAAPDLPKFSNLNDRKAPEDERSNEPRQKGRSWCAAPFVEVRLPVVGFEPILQALRKFVQRERRIVRDWAIEKFGSLEDAKPALLQGAQIPSDVAVWRGWLSQTQNPQEFECLADDDIARAMAVDAKGADLRVRRTVTSVASRSWVDATTKAIKASAPSGTDLDTLDRRLRAGLRGFFTAANSGKHTNPQFPFLTDEKPLVPVEDVLAQVLEFLDDEDKDRYGRIEEGDRKRHRVTSLQRELGRTRPRERREIVAQRWAGRPFLQGKITKRRDAALVWDGERQQDGLALALPTGGLPPIDARRYTYQDGTSLTCDGQLLTSTGRGKGCALMPLILKHDFRRWYCRHVENENPLAPVERRCLHNTTQFVIVEPDGPRPRLYIRPVFKFYEPERAVPDTHERWKKPACRYLVGIDRGVNYVLRAVVADTVEKTIIADIALPGRKHEWKLIREEIAYRQQMRDNARNRNSHPSVVRRHAEALARARKKDRALGKTETVEAVAKLVEQCRQTLGDGNFCFVMENLELGRMNLKRNNRVKHMAAVEDALINQMRKAGYVFDARRGQVDGVRFEAARYTSQVSPGGWWARREEIEALWKDDGSRPIGRRVGNWYEDPFEGPNGAKPPLYRMGRWMMPRDGQGRPYGRPRFCVEPGDEDSASRRRRNCGSELFWDPNWLEVKGRSFPQGVVVDADLVGALNIALRPLVNDGQGKGFNTERMAEGHVKLNPSFKIVCPLTVYEFVEKEGHPRGALQRVVLQ